MSLIARPEPVLRRKKTKQNNKMNQCVNNMSHMLKRFCILNWKIIGPLSGLISQQISPIYFML